MFKPVLPEQSVTVVSPFDPAIDLAQSDLDGYAEVALTDPEAWRKFFKFKEGCEPTEFEIGVIQSAKLIQIESECGLNTDNVDESKLRWLCFLNGIRDVRNFHAEVPKVSINGISYVDPEFLAKQFVRDLRKVASGMGAVIYFWNMLNDDEAKN